MIINPALAKQTHTYTLAFDTTAGKLVYSVRDEGNTLLVDRSQNTAGSDAGPVFNGIKLMIHERTTPTSRDGNWSNVGLDTSTYQITPLTPAANPNPGDYIVQFYDRGYSSVIGVKVFNVTDDPQRTKAVLDTAIRLTYDRTTYNFKLSETVRGVPNLPTWMFSVTVGPLYVPLDTVIVGGDTTIRYLTIPSRTPSFGDQYLLRTYKPFRAGDTFQFTVEQASQLSTSAAQELQRIRVVPNPYMVRADWELTPTQKRLAFTNLPPTCTIDIMTVTGELVRHIDRRESSDGWEWWNLLNSSNRMVAYGLYVYVVTVPDGTKTIGKFAVIR